MEVMGQKNVKNQSDSHVHNNTDETSPCSKGQWCVCCKYPTPVKLEKMIPYLDKYTNKAASKILKEGFKNGFKLAYLGDRTSRDSKNLKSITNLKKEALEKINKEVKLGRIAGPFHEKPLPDLIISPIGLVPKSEPGKYRLIQHLSYPEGESINDGIDRGMCKVNYTSFDVAVRLVVSAGKGALMAKSDIESAFRLLPVHPQDFQLLGIKVGDQYFVDKALPMGASCSPAHFERFSTFLEWVTIERSQSSRMCHYMDDMFFAGPKGETGPQSCSTLLETFQEVCKEFGVPLAADKTVGPTSTITFLGLQIDSEKQIISIPSAKLDTVKEKVERALSARKITLKDLQSLIGSLSFICRAISPGRAFLRRLIDQTCGVSRPWFKITLSEGALSDLRMWRIFMQEFNGVTIFPDQFWLGQDDLQLFTDACKSVGFGGYLRGKWFQGRWPEEIAKSRSIAWMEFFPIVVAIVLWSHVLRGKRIVLRSDNESVIAIINRQTSRCPLIMRLLRFFVLQCLKNNIAFRADHVPGDLNTIADALSRFQASRFRKAAPAADATPVQVPQFLWKL